jgi:nickel-dependent lactate racemase
MTLPATEVEELANSDEKAMKRDALERLKSKLDFIINMVVEQEK